MTHVFDMQLHKVQIPVDMPEWRERFPLSKTDEEVRYKSGITGAFKYGTRKTLPEEMPKVLVAPKPRKSWPDAFTGVNGVHVVSQKVRDIIETLDPGLHQFFPVRLETKRGVEIERPWFIMNVTERRESLVIDKSKVLIHTNTRSIQLSLKDVTVDPSKLHGINLWRETGFSDSLMGSDALIDAFKANGTRFFPSYKAKDL